jgi:hypothetical protein
VGEGTIDELKATRGTTRDIGAAHGLAWGAGAATCGMVEGTGAAYESYGGEPIGGKRGSCQEGATWSISRRKSNSMAELEGDEKGKSISSKNVAGDQQTMGDEVKTLDPL